MKFSELEINENIKKAIEEMGFEKTTPIQEKTIPPALKGKDILGQAQTGSGKTLAFTIPILNKIFIPDRSPQAIILSPTRELSIQIADEIAKAASNISKLKILPVYGGQPIGRQLRVLKKGVHIIVGTPGRVIDHLKRGSLDLIGISTVVLDEADEMLKMGFREDIEIILKETPKQKQTLLFSATIPKDIQKIAETYQNNPKFIKIPSTKSNNPKITQYYYKTNKKQKFNDLTNIININMPNLILIFSNTKKGVEYLVKQLKKNNYRADAIHGDMSQKTRDKVMNKFRNSNIDILVASDVVSRGIDVENISIVINYDVPSNVHYYTHRIGRTARAGGSGFAFTLLTPKDRSNFSKIQKSYKITERNVPTEDDVMLFKNTRIMEKANALTENDNLEKYIKIVKKNSKNKSYLEIAAALLKMMEN